MHVAAIIVGDRPRPESFEFFERALRSHSTVRSVERIADQIYRICRVSGSDVIVYLTDEYIVGQQFYLETFSRFPGINAIVTVSGWNSYTKDAKEAAAKDSVGVFVMKEFFGAINWKQYWKYLKKDAKGDPIRFWRERSPD